MLSEDAQKMKMRLEHFPSEKSFRVLASEIRHVQQWSFDQYVRAHAFPHQRARTRVQTSRLADPTAWLAVDGHACFEREKQHDLKRLVAAYRRDERFIRLALACIARLPEDEASLITRHCIHGEGIAAVALQIGLSRATGYRRYDEAVAHFTDLYHSVIRGKHTLDQHHEGVVR